MQGGRGRTVKKYWLSVIDGQVPCWRSVGIRAEGEKAGPEANFVHPCVFIWYAWLLVLRTPNRVIRRKELKLYIEHKRSYRRDL